MHTDIPEDAEISYAQVLVRAHWVTKDGREGYSQGVWNTEPASLSVEESCTAHPRYIDLTVRAKVLHSNSNVLHRIQDVAAKFRSEGK